MFDAGGFGKGEDLGCLTTFEEGIGEGGNGVEEEVRAGG